MIKAFNKSPKITFFIRRGKSEKNRIERINKLKDYIPTEIRTIVPRESGRLIEHAFKVPQVCCILSLSIYQY